MEEFKYEITASNANKTVAGSHSAVFGVMKELTKLEDQDQIITSVRVLIETISGAASEMDVDNECDNDKNYNNVIEVSSFGRSIDDSGNMFRETAYIHQFPKEKYDKIHQFMEHYTDQNFEYYVGWMSKERFCQFAIEFADVINNEFDEDILKDLGEINEETFDKLDADDLRDIVKETFKKYKLNYRIRKLSSGEKPYIADKN